MYTIRDHTACDHPNDCTACTIKGALLLDRQIGPAVGFRSPGDCPEEVAALVKECLESDPRDRPSAKDVAVRLKSVLARGRVDRLSRVASLNVPESGTPSSGMTLRNYSSSNLKKMPSFSRAVIVRKTSAPDAIPPQAPTEDTAHLATREPVTAGRAASMGATISESPLARASLERPSPGFPTVPLGPFPVHNTLDFTTAAGADVDAHADIPGSWIKEEGPQSPCSP